MMQELFPEGELPERRPKENPPPAGKPRLRMAERQQVEIRFASLDQLLPENHPARLIWEAVEQFDLSAWLAEIKAVEGHVGRHATDPRILLAIWIYAITEGIFSARKIDRLCERDLAFMWLCGGVGLNYHTISDFRSGPGEKFYDLVSDVVASLMNEGLVTLQAVAQDGMRVRANAGKSSFRRGTTLERCEAEARERVEILRQLAEQNPDELDQRQRAAQERAARERQERVAAAREHCRQLQQQREERAKTSCEPVKEARASTTDAEARVIKFANGGYDPGYNVQFATDVESGIIVGVEVNNSGNDGQQLPPMLDQLHDRYGRNPKEVLVDGGFATHDAITDAADGHSCTVFAPLKDVEKQLAKGVDPYAPKRGDSQPVAEWRARMGTEAADGKYKLRAQTAEWVNALCRNRGLRQMPVRGTAKCRNVALLYALTHNLLQALRLRALMAA
jgi:transposase